MQCILKAAFFTGILVFAMSAFGQIVPFPPELQNRIPPPLPTPPQSPTINGSLGRGASPGVYQPPRLDTFSDRRTRCLHAGSGYGLHGRQLSSYVHNCANAN
jgi:hypothetical protein